MVEPWLIRSDLFYKQGKKKMSQKAEAISLKDGFVAEREGGSGLITYSIINFVIHFL